MMAGEEGTRREDQAEQPRDQAEQKAGSTGVWSYFLVRNAIFSDATNPALAVNNRGHVGLLYQRLTGTAPNQRYETHLDRSSNGGAAWGDSILANTPAATPASTFQPYLGDYDYLMAVGRTFYGIFSANNSPNRANFPSGVRYQRNVDFDTNRLLGLDGSTIIPTSIDPFFVKSS